MRFIIIGGGCYGIYHSHQLYKAIQKGKLPADTRLIVIDRNATPPALAEHGHKPGYEFVQSDWQDYLLAFFSDPRQYDLDRDGETVHIVPPPYAPHLFFDWLRLSTAAYLKAQGYSHIQIEREGFEYKMHTPYEYIDPKNGNHFLSRAGWTCPAFCVEPRLCPAVKGVRDWDLANDLENFVFGRPVQPSTSAASRLAAAQLANGQPSTALLDTPPAGRYSLAETFKCHHYMHGIGTIAAPRLFEARERVVQVALKLDEAHPEARVAVGTVSHCHGVVATIALKYSKPNK